MITGPKIDPTKKHLVVLVADKDMELTIKGLLSRPQRLKINPVQFDCYNHPSRDSGCFLGAHEFLRSSFKTHERAMVFFDRHGCGRENTSREELEQAVEKNLISAGWIEGSVAAIVLDPELEVWVWSQSPHVAHILGWDGTSGELQDWLQAEKLWANGAPKPSDPKEAVLRTLRHGGTPLSASLYRSLAETVSLERCTDPSFAKFKDVMRTWFGTKE